MSEPIVQRMIKSASTAIELHCEELSELDRAIGDGDHGINMKRGFSALSDSSNEIATLPFGKALEKAGMTLVMKIGGASGPLFGSALMAMGKATNDEPQTKDDIIRLLDAGVEAVKSRGKSEAGAKTMLDVLIPLTEALRTSEGDMIATARRAADDGLASTRDMLATKGRASFLGERSIGHLDPGARSTALLVHTICDLLEDS